MTRAFLVAACLVAAVSCTRGPSGRGATGCSVAGGTNCRPSFEGPALDGKTRVNDETLGGRVVLVNFWATWCKPCARELPAIEAVYRRHSEHGLVVVGMISGDGTPDLDIFNFAAAHGVTYPLVRATPDVEQRFGLGSMLPISLLYDRGGHLVQRWNGALEEAALDAKVREVIAR